MKAGITFGAFDLCHAGHNLMFGECKQNCEYLIVGLQADPSIERQEKNKPVQRMFERYVQLNSCRYIDEIVPYVYESEIEEILSRYNETNKKIYNELINNYQYELDKTQFL